MQGYSFLAVADNGGEGVEHVECGQHHPAFKDAPSFDELLADIGKQTGLLAASSLAASRMREIKFRAWIHRPRHAPR